MKYSEALEYIHGVSWTFCKPGLDRIEALCQALGNPQDSLKFVHVAGTNGKGSFCSMLSSVLVESGLKVGLYTSPYILEFNERMRVDDTPISNATLARLTEKIRPIADAMEDKPTEFELITAIALEYFREEKVDVVVLECGMGGRLDSTNVISTSLLSVITGIALDHTAFLGNTVREIAKEKAGIIKPKIPVLYGGEDNEASEVIETVAKSNCSSYTRSDYKRLTVNSLTLDGTLFDYKTRKNVQISLLGVYQPKNASLVLDALDLLRPHFPTITEESIRKGLLTARWPARFEVISNSPLFIFDGAHNPQGIDAAAEGIKLYFPSEKVVAVSGVLRDKDYCAIAKKISEIASDAFTITPDSPRALSAEEYAAELEKNGVKAVSCASISEAVKRAKELAKQENKSVVCLGSLYTYAEVISAAKHQDSSF